MALPFSPWWGVHPGCEILLKALRTALGWEISIELRLSSGVAYLLTSPETSLKALEVQVALQYLLILRILLKNQRPLLKGALQRFIEEFSP